MIRQLARWVVKDELQALEDEVASLAEAVNTPDRELYYHSYLRASREAAMWENDARYFEAKAGRLRAELEKERALNVARDIADLKEYE